MSLTKIQSLSARFKTKDSITALVQTIQTKLNLNLSGKAKNFKLC